MTRYYDSVLEPVGIGLNQYAILCGPERNGERPLQTLADALVMDRSTLGRLLRPLEERGLVGIVISDQDRRQRLISLTRRGRTLLVRAKPLWTRAEQRFEREFGTQNALSLRRVLRRVTETRLGGG